MDMVAMGIIVGVCGLTAWLAHLGMAVFHDGLRPIIPEQLEGRMKRSEIGTIAFGLSIGFIVSVGIAHTVVTSILNPWLLFLTTDIIGAMSPKKWMAPILGGLWGGFCLISVTVMDVVFVGLPVDLIGAMSMLREPVVAGFALFPLVAIFVQFGWRKGAITAVITLIIRQLVAVNTMIYPESIQLLVGIIFLFGFAIFEDKKNKVVANQVDMAMFKEGVGKIRKNLVWLMLAGGFIAAACNIGIFAGSDVSSYMLAEAHIATDPTVAKSLLQQASLSELIRGLGFIPLVVTTALTTGVYSVAGLALIYPIGYLMPNPVVAAIAGAVMILLEVLLLGKIGATLFKFPSIRGISDNIRSTITTVLEFSILFGSISAVIEMGGYTGFLIGALIYFANEMTGKRIMKMAIGPAAVIATGILLNLMNIIGLFPIA